MMIAGSRGLSMSSSSSSFSGWTMMIAGSWRLGDVLRSTLTSAAFFCFFMLRLFDSFSFFFLRYSSLASSSAFFSASSLASASLFRSFCLCFSCLRLSTFFALVLAGDSSSKRSAGGSTSFSSKMSGSLNVLYFTYVRKLVGMPVWSSMAVLCCLEILLSQNSGSTRSSAMAMPMVLQGWSRVKKVTELTETKRTGTFCESDVSWTKNPNWYPRSAEALMKWKRASEMSMQPMTSLRRNSRKVTNLTKLSFSAFRPST